MDGKRDGLRAGDLVRGWCSKCHEATLRRFEPEGKRKLVCLGCEAREKREAGK